MMHSMADELPVETMDDPTDVPADLVATHGPFRLRATTVEVAGPVDFSAWEAALQWCQQVEQASPWWVGDLIEFGEHKYGEKYAQALDHTTYTEQALKDIAYVSRSVAPEVRRPEVSFTHHREVAPLPPSEQQTWLHKAETEHLTAAQLRHGIKIAQAEAAGQATELWLLVKCTDAADQDKLAERLKLEGRAVKPQVVKV